MLATLVDQPFDEPGWLYEIKWDGYRAVALINKGKVDLISRNNKSFNEKFYPVVDALKKWDINAVIDGEVVVLNEKGISNFGSLQNWRSEADGSLFYYVFDILWLNGYDLRSLPLTRRREILKDILLNENIIRLSENFETSATEFLATASKMGMEGIMAKKEESVYVEGDRTRDWLKIKSNKRHEVVIGGFTQNEGSAKTFSSLLVGVFDNGRLDYIGKIGTGFNDKTQKDIMSKMKKLITNKIPFTETPDIEKPSRFRPNPPRAKVTWLKPELVCEVSYTEITSDGVMRHPSFEGLRIDKKAKDVKKENAIPVEDIKETKKEKPNKYTKPVTDKEQKNFIKSIRRDTGKEDQWT
jgi:bifunctional non-homologous end joining protein LigD